MYGSKASGNVKDFLKPLFLTLEPPNYSETKNEPIFGVFKSEAWESTKINPNSTVNGDINSVDVRATHAIL